MMRLLNNEKGIALVMVMILSLIGLAMVSALLFMVTMGTRSSGSLRFYKTVEEASFGGAEIAVQFIRDAGTFTLPIGMNLVVTGDACLLQKLTTPRGNWDLANWTSCSADRVSPTIDTSPDIRFDLPGAGGNTIRVFGKIVDTVQGNTQPIAFGVTPLVQGGTLGGGGTFQSGQTTSPPTKPWLIRIEIQAEDSVNPVERSMLSVLYAH
jgi:hypothetical protein